MPFCVCVNKDIVAEPTDSCTFTAHGLTPPVQQKESVHTCVRDIFCARHVASSTEKVGLYSVLFFFTLIFVVNGANEVCLFVTRATISRNMVQLLADVNVTCHVARGKLGWNNTST